MVPHRYVIADIVTDETLGYLPLGGVSYSRRVGVAGDLQGSFPIGTRTHGALARMVNDRPLALYVYRGPSIWWGGIIWQAPIRKARRGEPSRCTISAAVFESLPERRRLFDDYELLDVDRGEALARLWDRMQADGPTAGALIDVGAPLVGGTPFTGVWSGPAAPPYAEAMTQVATADGGFEWTIDTWADDQGLRHRRLRVGTPLLGNTGPDFRPHAVANPGRVHGLEQIGDHTSRPTHAVGRGQEAGLAFGGATVPLTSPIVVDADAVAAGYPRVDGVVDVDTQDKTRLFDSAVLQLRGPLRVPAVTVTLPDGHSFHPGMVGDLGRATVDDPVFPEGRLDTVARIIGVTVQPPERGRPELVTFEFQDDSAPSQT